MTRVKQPAKLAAVIVAGTDTRTRILGAGWTLLCERRAADVTVVEIAKAASVSRRLVYFHFESRAGLLAAMARHLEQHSGFLGQIAAALRETFH